MNARRLTISCLTACTALGALSHTACAQALVSRSSKLNYNYVFGAGADSHTGGQDLPRVTPLMSDSADAHFNDSTSGVLPNGQGYTAEVWTDLSHSYTITGTPREIITISAQATSHVATATGGAGIAAMNATNPGNEVILTFVVTRSVEYHLTGALALPSATSASYVSLQHFNGIFWELVFYSPFLPNGQGPFNVSGTLPPGDYRMVSALGMNAQGNESFTPSLSYVLDVSGTGTTCSSDFDGDGDFGTDADIEAFFACLGGNCCTTCLTADFDGDGDTGTDADIESFFRALGGGPC